MVTGFIKLIFSIICLYIFLYNCSFANYEIKSKNNIIGGIFTLLFVLCSLVFSNVVLWMY